MQASLAEQYTILHNYNFVHSFLVVIEHEDLLCSLLESVLKAATDLLLTQHHHLIRLGEDPFSCEPFQQVSFSLNNTLTREQSKGGDIGWRSVQRLKVINVHLFFFYFLLDFQFLKLFGTLSRRVKVSQSYKSYSEILRGSFLAIQTELSLEKRSDDHGKLPFSHTIQVF